MVLEALDANDPQPRRDDPRFADYKAFRKADKAWNERERTRRVKRAKLEVRDAKLEAGHPLDWHDLTVEEARQKFQAQRLQEKERERAEVERIKQAKAELVQRVDAAARRRVEEQGQSLTICSWSARSDGAGVSSIAAQIGVYDFCRTASTALGARLRDDRRLVAHRSTAYWRCVATALKAEPTPMDLPEFKALLRLLLGKQLDDLASTINAEQGAWQAAYDRAKAARARTQLHTAASAGVVEAHL